MPEVYCETHGNQMRSAIICQHLFKSLQTAEVVGFAVPWEVIPEKESYEAWCVECMKILDEQQGWNDISEEFADFRLVCEACYEKVKNINS
jgi:hypothetical protein